MPTITDCSSLVTTAYANEHHCALLCYRIQHNNRILIMFPHLLTDSHQFITGKIYALVGSRQLAQKVHLFLYAKFISLNTTATLRTPQKELKDNSTKCKPQFKKKSSKKHRLFNICHDSNFQCTINPKNKMKTSTYQ